ncbi:ABC transporter permease [bacterium]|mgnify:FL=1|jgi:cell division transport system permease protein|nr:ABC transporter permease [bacterium]
MFRDWGFFITETMIGIKRSSLMAVISIVTVTVSLLVFGFFLLVTTNLTNLADLITSKLEIRIFLKSSLTQQEITQFQDRIKRIKGIESVKFVDKVVAWDEFRNQFQNLHLDSTDQDNPLPHSIRISLMKDHHILPVAKYLRGFDYYVDDLVYGGEIAERMERFSRLIHVFGFGLVGILGISTLLIIVNTIRLTVIARQDEISVMKLVGATNRFIQWPFLIEGFLIGFIGALMSVALLSSAYYFLGEKIQGSVPFFPLVFHQSELLRIFMIVALTGTGIGIVGAYISVSKTLKHQL